MMLRSPNSTTARKTVITSNQGKRLLIDCDEESLMDSNKVRMNHSCRLKFNRYEKMNHNVRPKQFNYLTAKLRRIDLEKQE